MIYNYKTLELEVKDVDRKAGIVSGYFAAFNIKDSDGDIIQKGAFSRSIQDWGPDAKGRVKHLLNHDPGKPLGKVIELKEDDYGLFYRSQIGKHDLGRDFVKMVESDLIKEHSIGFKDLTPEGQRKGDGFNTINNVMLYEGSSLTAWGANEFTPLVEMKGENKIDALNNRMKAFEKFVRVTDATDETIELCLLQIKQLAQIIETMSSIPAAPAPEQPKESKEAVNETLNHSLKSLQEWKISMSS
jgi:HK97 family phage prohead protease